MKVIGLAGWSGSGKTRLVVALVKEFSKKGLRVSTMKHAHHSFDVDQKGKDSYAHREAGAQEVLVASERRWALMHECRPEEKTNEAYLSPALLLKHLAPCDVLLVEGFKNAALDKLEIHRSSLHQEKQQPLFATSDPRIRAIVSDTPKNQDLLSHAPLQHALPVFDADEPKRIADFILQSNLFLPPSLSPPSSVAELAPPDAPSGDAT